MSRLTQIAHNLSGTANDQTYDFDHNPAGQVTSKTTSNSLYNFLPDIDLTDIYGTANGLNQVASANGGGVTFTHDARGNMTDDGTNTYAYDADSETDRSRSERSG